MEPTDGMQRGMQAFRSRRPHHVPWDRRRSARAQRAGARWTSRSSVEAAERWPIHRPAPAADQATELQMFETGIKVIDLIEPTEGGQDRLFGGAGVGKTVIIQN